MRPTLEDEWDLEPWDDDPDGFDAHYIRESSEPAIDDEGREIWLYVYSPGGACWAGVTDLWDGILGRP
jgi:hypothetical protein